MSDAYVGEIRMFSGNFAPLGWALCNGQLLPIAQNTALFSILGVTYGGDGINNFALPNLQARVPIGAGQGPGLSIRLLGASSGAATVALTSAQLPVHQHLPAASSATSGVAATSGSLPASAARIYGPPSNLVAMSPAAIGSTGQGLPHDNLQPYQVVTYIIALQGIFPPRA